VNHPERVQDYIGHILDAIDRCTSYLLPVSDLQTFQSNAQVQDAVVRNIEIIGEAVAKINNISPEFITSHVDIPWQQMRAMRNVIIHEYFFVDLQIVWNTVKNDFPKLKRQIKALSAQ
jgi:uncharacterized protein with HEPN domain